MTFPATPVPPRSTQIFRQGITHPELWLWDSWTVWEGDILHLYTLALSRQTSTGAPIHPENRNDHPFHFRHFISEDRGGSWTDQGAVLHPDTDTDTGPKSYYSRNVWSGSATVLPDGRKLIGFTGIRAVDDEHLFLQSISLYLSGDGHSFDMIASEPLSCPQRDYEAILSAGYYLGPKEALGSKNGEDGGPILAWRDPYTFFDAAGVLHCVWSAKVGPKIGALAHAVLRDTKHGFVIDTLYPPITLPDSDTITQAEVPKIFYDDTDDVYYCLLSACDRLYEGQTDSEVTKTLRLYKSANLRGPWKEYREASAIIPNLAHMFGASVISTDFDKQNMKIIAPITEMASLERQLTIAPVQSVDFAN